MEKDSTHKPVRRLLLATVLAGLAWTQATAAPLREEWYDKLRPERFRSPPAPISKALRSDRSTPPQPSQVEGNPAAETRPVAEPPGAMGPLRSDAPQESPGPGENTESR